jgi:hypothetical protein
MSKVWTATVERSAAPFAEWRARLLRRFGVLALALTLGLNVHGR